MNMNDHTMMMRFVKHFPRVNTVSMTSVIRNPAVILRYHFQTNCPHFQLNTIDFTRLTNSQNKKKEKKRISFTLANIIEYRSCSIIICKYCVV